MPSLNMLCETCQAVFKSHWVSKEAIADLKNATPDKTSPDTENASTKSDDSLYEKLDWVTLVPEEQQRVASHSHPGYTSPLHHAVRELEESARNACHLCVMIWDRFEYRIGKVSEELKAGMLWTRGVAVCRPRVWPDKSDVGPHENLALELLYFLEGRSHNRDAYYFTVRLDVLPMSTLAGYPLVVPESHVRLSGGTLQSIVYWMTECSTNHAACRKQTASEARRLPARLLDVNPEAGPESVRLVETGELEVSTNYMTLSHCWGSVLPTRLLAHLYEEFIQAIRVTDLPRTFQDAVEFTRAIGIRYLWIDALCIIQDTDDWLHEALLMSSVYTDSRLNLAATSSTDSHGGLFKERNALLKSPCIINATWEGFAPGSYVCFDPTNWVRRVVNGPLNRRGWVLQERLLAPRTAHFAHDQIWWNCSETRGSESFPGGVPDYAPDLEPQIDKILAQFDPEDHTASNVLWLQVVEEYTKTRLTKNSDKLVAIAGIATKVGHILGWSEKEYLAGLWKHELVVDLLWQSDAMPNKRITPHVAPSWSWASMSENVSFGDQLDRTSMRDKNTVEVLGVTATGSGSAMGFTIEASLTIRAPLHKIELSRPDTSNVSWPKMREVKIGGVLSPEAGFAERLDEDSLYYEWYSSEHDIYFCRFVTFPSPHLEQALMTCGLILEATGAHSDVYRRVGCLRLFHDDPKSLFTVPLQVGPVDVNGSSFDHATGTLRLTIV